MKKPWPARSCYVRTELWGYFALEPPSNYYLCSGYYSSLISFWRHFGLHCHRCHWCMSILEKTHSVLCHNWSFFSSIAKDSNVVVAAVQYVIVVVTAWILQIKEGQELQTWSYWINSDMNLQTWKAVMFLPVRYFSPKCLTWGERKPCLKILHFCWGTKWNVRLGTSFKNLGDPLGPLVFSASVVLQQLTWCCSRIEMTLLSSCSQKVSNPLL